MHLKWLTCGFIHDYNRSTNDTNMLWIERYGVWTLSEGTVPGGLELLPKLLVLYQMQIKSVATQKMYCLSVALFNHLTWHHCSKTFFFHSTDKGLQYEQTCTSTSKSKCGCQPGKYCIMGYDGRSCGECSKYRVCLVGHGVSVQGTAPIFLKSQFHFLTEYTIVTYFIWNFRINPL